MNTKDIKNIVLTEGEYVKPQIEIIDIDNETVLAASFGGDAPGMEFGGEYDGWT